MRRGVITAAVIACCLMFSSAGAAIQVEKGIVAVPSPGRAGKVIVDGCPGVVAGTVQWAAGVRPGPRFAVKSATWGASFTLTPNHPAANIDIGFRTPNGWVEFLGPWIGGEKGRVPPGAVEALVCLSYGAPARFTYRAG